MDTPFTSHWIGSMTTSQRCSTECELLRCLLHGGSTVWSRVIVTALPLKCMVFLCVILLKMEFQVT